MDYVKGTNLCATDIVHVLRAFVHRFTRDFKPSWAMKPRPDGTPYKPQFASDGDWLANTQFAIRRDGRLDRRVSACQSYPTWPDGK